MIYAFEAVRRRQGQHPFLHIFMGSMSIGRHPLIMMMTTKDMGWMHQTWIHATQE